MDILECVSDMYLYWENPWGNMVTLRFKGSVSQFRKIMGIMQFAIDTMAKKQLLNH